MPELRDQLAELAADAVWPPTPDLAPRVLAAIESAPAPSRARPRTRRPLLAALLALVLGGGVLAAPGAGSGLLEAVGLKGARVTQVQRLAPAPLGGPLALGDRYTLADARRVAGFAPLRPAALGEPAEVYVDDGVVAFVYRARSGRPIVFTQVPGSAGRYVEKLVTAPARQVRIGGRPGLLLRGPHVVVFDGRGGRPRTQEARLAKNTLMWERGGLLLRLEAEQPLGELLRIARSTAAARAAR